MVTCFSIQISHMRVLIASFIYYQCLDVDICNRVQCFRVVTGFLHVSNSIDAQFIGKGIHLFLSISVWFLKVSLIIISVKTTEKFELLIIKEKIRISILF